MPSEDRITHYIPLPVAEIGSNKPSPAVSEELLGRKYAEYNKLYFNGKLPACSIRFEYNLTIQKKKPGYAYYNAVNSEIVMDYACSFLSDGYIRSILIHEMIHHYIYTFYRANFDSEPSHGATFQKIRRYLNDNYQLRIDQRI